jgi:hypothetical protein
MKLVFSRRLLIQSRSCDWQFDMPIFLGPSRLGEKEVVLTDPEINNTHTRLGLRTVPSTNMRHVAST